MLPFSLYGQKGLGVAGWHRRVYTCERLLQFVAGMRHQHFQRAFVNHRNDATLDSLSQQIAHYPQECSLIHAVTGFPSLLLRLDIGEQFRQRLEFNEAVNRESDWAAVLLNYRGRVYEYFYWNSLR